MCMQMSENRKDVMLESEIYDFWWFTVNVSLLKQILATCGSF